MPTKKLIALSIAVLILTHINGNVAADAKFSKISKIELRPYFQRQFKQPVFVAPYPGKLKNCSDAYAIVEKPGVIRLESPEKKCGLILADLRDRVAAPTLEEGLLGLAFPPDFQKSGSYYVYYSAAAPRRTIIARLDMKGKSGLGSNRVTELLTIRQPFSNHNGGMLEFGPDGFLYIGVGDGGSGGDPRGYAQNTAALLGKILRIDPSTGSTSSPAGTLRYKIPAGNPFAKSSGVRGEPQREIFAWGLRNPWRFSFTPEGELIVGDVGQNDYEEISIVRLGENMGWNITEGYHCFKPKKNCNKTNLREPIYEYDHGVGQSILGGYVYTGSALQQYRNKYIFADSISGRIFALDYRTRSTQAELLIQAPGLWSSFGRLRNGELVISELQSGKIFLLSPTGQVGSR